MVMSTNKTYIYLNLTLSLTCVCVYTYKEIKTARGWMFDNDSLGGEEELSSSNESSAVNVPLLTLEEICENEVWRKEVKVQKRTIFFCLCPFPPYLQTNITIPADPPNPGTKGGKEKRKQGGEISRKRRQFR